MTSHTLIPRRRETWIHATLVFRQRRDGLSVLIVETDMLRVEIGLLALAPRRLRDRGDAILIEQPFQRHLRRPGAMLAADRRQLRVRSGPALRRPAIVHHGDRFAARELG